MIITINCIGTLLLLIARILRCPTSMFEGFKIVDKTCYTYKENKFLTEEAYRVNQRKKRRTLMSNVWKQYSVSGILVTNIIKLWTLRVGGVTQQWCGPWQPSSLQRGGCRQSSSCWGVWIPVAGMPCMLAPLTHSAASVVWNQCSCIYVRIELIYIHG